MVHSVMTANTTVTTTITTSEEKRVEHTGHVTPHLSLLLDWHSPDHHRDASAALKDP